MKLILLRRAGLVFLLFISFGTAPATAGPVYLTMVIDPPTTAGFGVPEIPREFSTGSFSVTSNKSGPGTFHVYALDGTTGSFGLSFFRVAFDPLAGAVTNVLNRSPIGSFDTLDDQGGSVENQNGSAGFSDPLVRSGVGRNPINPLVGSQAIGSSFRIGGLGQTASNFNNTPNLPAVPSGGTRPWAAVTSGQWGNYATDPPSLIGRSWLFLGEGNYTPGNVPSIDFSTSTALYYSSANFNSQAEATRGNGFGYQVEVDNVNANDPGVVTSDLSGFYTGPPPDAFSFLGYKNPAGVSSRPSLAHDPTIDPITKEFRWTTTGAAMGEYSWHSSYGGQWNPHVDITVRITAVPEPATISLLGIALTALCNSNRRRR